MRITSLEAHRVRYALAAGPFEMSGGRVTREAESVIVRLRSDDGLSGWGEACVIHPSYSPGLAGSALAAISLLGEAVLGLDFRRVEAVHARMESAVAGYAYAKSALDIACWDLFGRATGMPVAELLGGVRQSEIDLYTVVGMNTPDAMASACRRAIDEGYRQVQIKVGGAWREDVARIEACAEALAAAETTIVDANCGWTQADAIRALRAVSGHQLIVEQPCRTIEECASVRRAVGRPVILDESLAEFVDVVRAREAGALDGARLKLSRSGGITPVRKMRDLAVGLGLPTTVEDTGGGGVIDAAVTALNCSTDPRFLACGYLPGAMMAERMTRGAPAPDGGRTTCSQGAGLGIELDEAAIGEPVLRLG